MIIRIMTLLVALAASQVSIAELKPISDAELDNHHGQALFRLEETNGVAQPDGSSLDFTKLTLGLKIEQNVTIDKIIAGRYYRPDGNTDAFKNGNKQTCFSAKICYYDQLNPWNCSNATCGGIGQDTSSTNYDENTFNVAALLYGSVFDDLSGLDHKLFIDFQSGFDPTGERGDVDAILRDMTLGFVNDSTGELYSAVAERPYIELAYSNESGIRSVEGFRIGFENQNGVMGNAIDVFSGYLVPSARMSVAITLGSINIGAAQLDIEPWVGGVRTGGYIDPNKSVVNSCIGIACNALVGGIVGGNPATPEGLAGASPEAQVFPLQGLALQNSSAFTINVQKSAVQYPDLPSGATPEVALPGVWLNLGGDEGLQVSNSRAWHPDNYFPGHPRDSVYDSSNNVKNGYY